MPNKMLSIRAPEETLEALKVAADRADRSVTSFVVAAIHAAMAMGPSDLADYVEGYKRHGAWHDREAGGGA